MCMPGGSSPGPIDPNTSNWSTSNNKMDYSWMTPGQDVLNQLGLGVTESMGYNFGQRNLFGSGIQQQATMAELIRQALGKTQLVNTGNQQNQSTIYAR